MPQPPTRNQNTPDTAQALADVSAVLHDLRAPLGGIDAMVELLSQTQLDHEQDRLVSALQAASRHLRAVADSVLGNATAPLTASTLASQIRTIADAAQARATARGLAFELHIEAGLPAAIAMPATNLRRVLENLIDNAIKATAAGTISLAVTREDNHACISLTDTGTGMNNAQQRQLVASNTQSNMDANARTGLGLTLIQQLVESAHGTVACVSDTDKGTSICMRLPIAMPSAPASRPRVLIVDDHPVNRQILSVMLHHFGCNTLDAASGEEALLALETERVDLILLDEILPGLSGLETLRQIRRRHELPVFATTGQVSVDLKNAYAAAGSTGFIEKPLTAEAVQAAIIKAQALSEKAQRAA